MAISANIIAKVKTLGNNNIAAIIKTPGVTVSTIPPIELKNGITGVGQTYLHNLLDVQAEHPQDGQVLVYNANSNKYIVTTLIVEAANSDGGSF